MLPRMALRLTVFVPLLVAVSVHGIPLQVIGGEPEVVIEAIVFEVSRTSLRDLVVAASSSTDETPGFAVDVSESVVRDLASSPGAKVLQSLELPANTGKVTRIRIGSRVKADSGSSATDDPVQYIDADIDFELTPTLLLNREISLTTSVQVLIRPEEGTTGASGHPSFGTSAKQHAVRFHEGRTVVMGGFVTDAEARELTNMPMLRESPILRYLFPNEGGQSDSEVVVLFTPRIRRTLDTRAVELPPITQTSEPGSPVPNAGARYAVQVGAFRDQANASALLSELSARYQDVFIETFQKDQTFYRVRVGRFPFRQAALQLELQLRTDGFEPVIVPLN